MRRLLLATALCTIVAGSCAPGDPELLGPPLAPMTGADLSAIIEASDRPVLVNVWASWCIPCRSEAPLLRAAHAEFHHDVRFIGVDVRDSQASARAFVAEFDIPFENYFDPGRQVPSTLGGRGVPITYFFDAHGELVTTHSGVIDERTLALNIDEILRR